MIFCPCYVDLGPYVCVPDMVIKTLPYPSGFQLLFYFWILRVSLYLAKGVLEVYYSAPLAIIEWGSFSAYLIC